MLVLKTRGAAIFDRVILETIKDIEGLSEIHLFKGVGGMLNRMKLALMMLTGSLMSSRFFDVLGMVRGQQGL